MLQNDFIILLNHYVNISDVKQTEEAQVIFKMFVYISLDGVYHAIKNKTVALCQHFIGRFVNKYEHM